MSRRDGTNQYDRHEMRRQQRLLQADEKEKFPNLIGRAVRGFRVTFEDGTEVEHKGELLTLNPALIQPHGKIREAVPIT
ncbi:MAG: hypothetical protein KJ729_04435 [Euryarchaeota archaeon]|nr:hypothetical protein [Euryarchaeota archaeon]